MDFSKFQQIDTFIFDVDGVFTNSSLLISEQGEMQRTVSTRDGEGIKQALKAGYKIIIITGGNSLGMKKRFSYLKVLNFHDDVKDKWVLLQKIMQKDNLSLDNILYMGDDLPDIPVLQKVAISACPSDAAHDVLSICQYISTVKGGNGCVREVIETVMRIQEKWPTLGH